MSVEQKAKKVVEAKGSVDNGEEIKKLLQTIETVSYGSVTVIIQEGKIVQIEKNEKLRIK